MNATIANAQNIAIFTMGLPAAGKSTWVNANLADSATVIDPDAVKEAHADYDPKNPQALHAWSQEVVEGMWAGARAHGGRYVIDGTGTNAEKMVRRIKEARAAGMEVALVYVTCSLATSLARNGARARVVPPHVVIEKARDISTSFEIVKAYADVVEIIDNDPHY